MTSISENYSNNMFEDAILLHHNKCPWFSIGVINHMILLFFKTPFFSKVKYEYLSDETWRENECQYLQIKILQTHITVFCYCQQNGKKSQFYTGDVLLFYMCMHVFFFFWILCYYDRIFRSRKFFCAKNYVVPTIEVHVISRAYQIHVTLISTPDNTNGG